MSSEFQVGQKGLCQAKEKIHKTKKLVRRLSIALKHYDAVLKENTDAEALDGVGDEIITTASWMRDLGWELLGIRDSVYRDID